MDTKTRVASGLGDDKLIFITAVQKMAESVWDFHERFDTPIALTESEFDKLSSSASNRISEEFNEYKDEINIRDFNLAGKELVDLVYASLDVLCRSSKFSITDIYEITRKNNLKNRETHYLNSDGKVRKIGT